MKTKSKHLFIYVLFALFYLTSCQDEITEVNTPNDQETIVANSTLANLMGRTTANYGAADDILDESSCFSVELPVTIVISDITFTIETQSDLDELENLLNYTTSEDNVLDFIFPITIIFSDYSETVIANEEALESFINACVEDETNAIDCVDFVYPMSFSVFNAEFNLIDTVIIENDESLYGFLDGLEDDENAVVVSLNFPVSLEYANGETTEVNTNQELSDAIEVAGDDCYDNNCTEDSVASQLEDCQWKISTYSSFPEFVGIELVFYLDNTFAVFQDGSTYNVVGDWSVSSTDGETFLNLDSGFEDLGGDWKIVECDDETIQFIKGEQTMVLNQVCEDDLNCSLSDISTILQECPWDFSDGTGNFENNSMIFNTNGDLQISEGMATSAIGGGWNLSVDEEGVILNFSELTAFQDALEGDWVIVECDADSIVLVKGDQMLVLEQDCNSDLFNCFDNYELVECANQSGSAVFNLNAETIGLVDCMASYIPSFHETLIDAETNVNALTNTEAYEATGSEIFLRIEASNGDFEIFSIFLNTIECNYFECFQSFDAVLETCYSDATVLYDFNLPIAFSNCTPSADVVSYYETQSNATADINPIANPVSYNTAELNTTIYTRVEINGMVEIFPIQLNVVNCNAGSCTEGDVSGILAECQWNITSYNGSDNLVNYNLAFEQDTEIVVIYTDTITINAGWSTAQTNNGVVIDFSNVAEPNIQAINGSWLVVECTANQLVLHNVNDSSIEIVLDRTCE
ncbi:hypothetical protein [Winogradskyella sp. SM1960]|uniref:hypothetical protein n=1 Tax=Winogradskyella sp. SM1960 TaxID=2865955 RepID=UPI001CD8136A|nr:hypothetical protein [Winogradskyella sp. SM1960]